MDNATPVVRMLRRYYFMLPAVAIAVVAVYVGGWAGAAILFFCHSLVAWGVAKALPEDGYDAGIQPFLAQLLLLTVGGAVVALMVGAPTVMVFRQPGWLAYGLLAACSVILFLGGLRFWPTPGLVFSSDRGSGVGEIAGGAVRGALALTRNGFDRAIEGAPLFLALAFVVLIPFLLVPFGAGTGGSQRWWVVFGVFVLLTPFIYFYLFVAVNDAMSASGRPRLGATDGPEPTTLGQAAAAGDVKAIRQMARETPIDTLEEGRTALMSALGAPAGKRREAIRAVLDLECNVNATTDKGRSALHLCAMSDDVDSASLLLDRGADADLRDNENHTALVKAAMNAAWQTMGVLLSHTGFARDHSDTPPLHAAAMARRDETAGVEMLLEAGAEVDQRGKLGRTALMGAAIRGNANIARKLLDAGADVNAGDEFGNTPLIEAARAGANKVLDCLTPEKPDTERKDKPGRTALLVAVSSRRADAETIEKLLALGADSKARNREGRSAADLASAGGRWAIANALGVKRREAPGMTVADEDASVIDLRLFETAEDRSWAEARLKKRSRTELSAATEVMPVLDLSKMGQELDAVVDIEMDGHEEPSADAVQALESAVAEAVEPRQVSEDPADDVPEPDSMPDEVDELDSPAQPLVTTEEVYQDLVMAAGIDDTEGMQGAMAMGPPLNERLLASAFLTAVAKGATESPGWLLDHGLSANARGEAGTSLLAAVVQQSPPNLPVIRGLLEAGARAQKGDDIFLWLSGMADLHHKAGNYDRTVEMGIAELVSELANHGAALDDCDSKQRTPLHWAVRYRSSAYVNAMIEQGAEVDATDQAGNTALLMATHAGRTSIVRILVRAGGDPKLANAKGISPLSLAMERQDHTLGKLLMTSDAPSERSRSTATAEALLEAAAEGNGGRVKRLLAGGLDPNAVDARGVTPLIVAAGKGHGDIVATLLNAGADTSKAANRGTTALGAAVLGDQIDIVGMLLEAGVPVDQPQQYGITPLALAAARWRPKMVATLLRAGADANATDETDGSPLGAAVQNAISGGNIDAGLATVKLLIRGGANVNDANDEGQTPLMLLLGVRARKEIECQEEGLLAMARQLIDAGANVEQQDASGWSALHAAASHGFHDVAELLMDSGCSRRVRDINGLSPVDLAMDNAHDALVDLFIQRS